MPPPSDVPEHGRDPRRLAPLIGAVIGSCLLIAAYVLVFVMGRHPSPDRADSWGWCLEAVLSGVGVGTLYGSVIGGMIGFIVFAISRTDDR